GIPYAVVKVGWLIGVLYIVCLGLLIMGLNLMLGEITLRTKEPLQLAGLAGRYLGRRGKTIMATTSLFSSFGALLAYLIGEGVILQSLLGGSLLFWSLIFWAIASFFVFLGLSIVKKADILLTLIILGIVLAISFLSAPQIKLPHLSTTSLNNILLPFGVILFALQGASAIPQVKEILPASQKRMKTAIITASLIIIGAYLLFMTAVLGVTGQATTEVATIGLGKKLGNGVLILASVFGLFTMGTCFLNVALAIKRVFIWDFKISRFKAWLITVGVPLILFLAGIRSFIKTIDFIGSLFGSLTAIFVISIYWRAKQKGDLTPHRYKLHHTLLLSVLIIIIFLIASLYNLFAKL
ncbi:MAG: hypothetical protein HY982_01990, partial [Candidatus Magasanikbacteria bacterium]|nr:hypothetical protein [Candidatus Magasanikbacteria bacterium]